MNVEKIGKALFGFSYALSFIILIIIAFLNVFLTMCYTGSFTVRNPYFDMTAAIIGIIIAIAIMYALNRMTGFISRMKLKHVIMISIAFTVIIAFTWLTLSGFRDRGDGENMMKIGFDIIRNDYHDKNYIYLQRYPYQSGVLIIMLPFIMLFQNMNLNGVYLMMSYANIILMIITMLNLIFIAKRLNGEKTAKWTALILMMFIPLPLSMIQVYGNIMSLPLITGMILLAISINDNKTFKPFIMRILSILILAIIAGFIKPNNMIIGIAITIILIVCSMIRINWKHAITGIIIIPFMMIGAALAPALLQGITGVDYNENMKAPARNFMIMGLNDDAAGGYGFFKWNIGSTRYTLDESNRNADNTWRKQSVKFKQPSYLIDFFRVKTMETWAEPTFSYVTRPAESYYYSEYVKQNSIDNDDKDGIVENAKEPVLHETIGQKIIDSNVFMIITRSWLDGLCILISSFAIIGIMRNRHDAYGILLGVCILGGFLFHLIWETKPEYAYTYFILLIPYAAMITNDFSIDNIAGKNNDKKSLIKSFQHD